MTNQLAGLLFKILKAYGVSITYSSIEQEVSLHPEYPSMKCISDILDKWNVNNVVMNLTLDKLRALNVPVIVHLKKGVFIWITQIDDSKVYFWSATGKEKTLNLEQFEQEWSGVSLAIKNIDNAGEPDYKTKRRTEIKEDIFNYLIAGGFVGLLVLLLCFSWRNDDSMSLVPRLLLFAINAFGCFISYILIRQEKRQFDALSDKFCRVGKHIDCKQVTTSKYSKFFGFISWAELGATYFSSLLIWIAIAPLSINWLPPIWWFSLVVLPFTLWSLVTQAFFIRKWCLFCCTVILLLWANATVLFFCHPYPPIISIPDIALLALLLLACFVAVFEKCKTIGSKERLYAHQGETAKIKYDILTIKSQLSETVYPIDNLRLTWDTPDASNNISLYVSIGCSHCNKAIKELRRMIEVYPNFSYKLVFMVNSDEFENNTNAIIRQLINLYKTMNRNEFFDMLDIWYKMPEKTLESLQNAFPVSCYYDSTAEIDALHQFYQQSNISYTPAILLNGQIMSKIYSYKDLMGIIRTLNAEE